MRHIAPGAMENSARYNAEAVRNALRHRGFLPDKIVRYCYRPFDVRWLYWEPETDLLDRKREDLFAGFRSGTIFLISRPKAERQREGTPFYVAIGLPDWHLTRPGSACLPMGSDQYQTQQRAMFDGLSSDGRVRHASGSSMAHAYLSSLGVPDGEPVDVIAMHALAIGYSPDYLAENAGALIHDWPRIPLPDSQKALLASAELGREIARLLDTERPVTGVTQGTIRPELKVIGLISHSAGDALNPDADDLDVTVGWGHRGRGGISMPGRGRLTERDYSAAERAAIGAGAAACGLSPDEAFALLGETTYDVYLNDRAYWRNVPARVWGYTIGGYQVMKKWLSYRETALVGRSLRVEEVREVTNMARRIAAILLLEPRLDANYQAVKVARYEGRPSPPAPLPILGEGGH